MADVFEELLNVGESVKIIKGISEALDKNSEGTGDNKVLNAHRSLSVAGMTNLISHQTAAKLSLNPLLFSGIKKRVAKKLTKWANKIDFLLLRYELERKLVVDGKAFLGYQKIDGVTYPFISTVQSVEFNPVTKKILSLQYVVGEISISKKSETLSAEYKWNIETKKYDHTRTISGNLDVPEEYAFKESVEFIAGEYIENNSESKNDIDSIIGLMGMRGKFVYEISNKFDYLSPKVFNKDKISNVKDKDMKTKTFININTRSGQYGAPMTVFNPTLPNEVIMKTIDWLEDKIFLLSISSRPSDSGKQAQTGNLEMSLKNEQANNYVEYKKNLRELQLTKFIIKVANSEGISLNEDFKTIIKLSKTQERLLNPEIDGDAAQGKGGQ